MGDGRIAHEARAGNEAQRLSQAAAGSRSGESFPGLSTIKRALGWSRVHSDDPVCAPTPMIAPSPIGR